MVSKRTRSAGELRRIIGGYRLFHKTKIFTVDDERNSPPKLTFIKPNKNNYK